MAYLPQTSTFDVGIYQIETADDVIGGVDGISNMQAKALGNRTKYLKDHVDTAEANIITINADLAADEVRLDALETSLVHTLGSNFAHRGIITINSGAPILIPGSAYGKLIIVDLNSLTTTCRLPTLTGLTVGMKFSVIIIASSGSYTGGKCTFSSVDGTIIGDVSNFVPGDSVTFIVKASGEWIMQVGCKRNDSTAPGKIGYFARATAPHGWIAADGSAISRTTYARLFAEIGVQNGVGNGTTTFNVPDMRGMFLRGLDNGRGYDVGRVFGTLQTDAIKNHVHPFTVAGFNLDGTQACFRTANNDVPADNPTGTTSNNTGGNLTETRPVNMAFPAFIKY